MELLLASIIVVILFMIGRAVRGKEELWGQAEEHVLSSLEGSRSAIPIDYENELIQMYYCYLVTEDLEVLYDFNDKYNEYVKV